jgi:hypothetical protein
VGLWGSEQIGSWKTKNYSKFAKTIRKEEELGLGLGLGWVGFGFGFGFGFGLGRRWLAFSLGCGLLT